MDSVSSRNDLDCCAGYCDVCRFVCDSFHNFEDEQALREDERDCNRIYIVSQTKLGENIYQEVVEVLERRDELEIKSAGSI